MGYRGMDGKQDTGPYVESVTLSFNGLFKGGGMISDGHYRMA